MISSYSTVPKILPLMIAFDPVDSEIKFPQDLHVTAVVA